MRPIRLALSFFPLLCWGGFALAHAFLESAVPAVGGTVSTPPKEVSITFTDEVEPSFSKIEVTDAAGKAVDSGGAHLSKESPKVLTVGLQPLPPGTYHVNWHVTSVDTHKSEGSFTFTVTP